jgi:hypothetical protein
MERFKSMPYMISIAIVALFSGSALALPSDFAGLKLGQNLGASKKFLIEKGHNIIYPDGKILWSKGEKTFKPADLARTISGESKNGQLCTVAFEPLSPNAKNPHIQSFNCGVVRTKGNNDLNSDRVIDTFIISHLMTEKDEKAFYLTYLFNLKTAKPAGAGIYGKFGEPDTVNAGQPCPSFVKSELGLKGPAADKGCFVAIWLPDGSEVMATAIGHGTNLNHGKIARLELWDMEAQKKVESFKANKAAQDLGF